MKIFPIIKNKFISTLIGSLILFLGVSFLLPINNFTVYITSYIHLNQTFVTMHYGLFISLIFSFSNSFSNPIGGYLENLIGFKKTIILGFIILFTGNLFFIFQQNIWLCYFLTIIIGVGAGIGTSLIGKNLSLFAPHKKGTIGGIMGLGILLITASFALIGEKIISYGGYTLQKGEEFYPEYIAKRTYLYYLFGEICIPIGLILSFLFIYEYKPEYTQENMIISNIKKNKKEKNEEDKEPVILQEETLETIEKKEEIPNKNNNNGIKNENSKANVMKAIKNIRYWRITFISLFLNFPISFMVNTGRTFGALIRIDGKALQFVMIIQAIARMIIGPVLGILVDKKGPLFILRIVSILSIVPYLFLSFFMETTWIFLAAFTISTINITGLMASFGPFIMEIFGIRESVILGGVVNALSKFSDIISTITAFVVSIYFKGDSLKVPYKIIYIIGDICAFLATFLLFKETNDKFKYDDIKIEENLMKKENEFIELGRVHSST